MPLFGLESSRLLSPDLGSNGFFLKGLKFKNRRFSPASARPSRGGTSDRQLCIFGVVCGSSAGKRRAPLERELVHIVSKFRCHHPLWNFNDIFFLAKSATALCGHPFATGWALYYLLCPILLYTVTALNNSVLIRRKKK